MCSALCDNWAGSANRFGSNLTSFAAGAALAIWMEEHLSWKGSASTLILPFPIGFYRLR
jgi:hypothetical protein